MNYTHGRARACKIIKNIVCMKCSSLVTWLVVGRLVFGLRFVHTQTLLFLLISTLMCAREG